MESAALATFVLGELNVPLRFSKEHRYFPDSIVGKFIKIDIQAPGTYELCLVKSYSVLDDLFEVDLDPARAGKILMCLRCDGYASSETRCFTWIPSTDSFSI